MRTFFKSTILFTVGVTLSLLSCKKEEIPLNEAPNHSISSNIKTVTDPNLIKMIKALEMNDGNITEGVLHLPTGTSEEYIFVNDIMISKKNLLTQYSDLQNKKNGLAAKHYKTKNIISSANRTIDIVGMNSGDVALSKKAQKALKKSVADYNNLKGHSLKFNLKFKSFNEKNFDNNDIVVFDASLLVDYQEFFGGMAEFPKNNKPGASIFISNLDNFAENEIQGIFTHEIGHAIGFRHTDWKTGKSCSGFEEENIEKVTKYGAVHIKGTSKTTLKSIYVKCQDPKIFKLTSEDKKAIKKLYPPKKKKKK